MRQRHPVENPRRLTDPRYTKETPPGRHRCSCGKLCSQPWRGWETPLWDAIKTILIEEGEPVRIKDLHIYLFEEYKPVAQPSITYALKTAMKRGEPVVRLPGRGGYQWVGPQSQPEPTDPS